MVNDLDVRRAPRGTRAAARLVDTLSRLDDRVERHYLEVKSSIGEGKAGYAKVAKFILGAANRMPEVAASAFEGYAVMVIGIDNGVICGVPPVEIKDFEEFIVRYIGPNGPGWDLVHVPVENSENSVLVFLVEPPEDGQDLFPCRKDGDNLHNGRIYIRADGQTREARADEIDKLLERGRRTVGIEPLFEVEVVGAAHRIDIDAEQTICAYLSRKRAMLLNALPKPKPESEESSHKNTEKDSKPRSGFSPSSASLRASELISESGGFASALRSAPGLSGVGESLRGEFLKAMNAPKRPEIFGLTRIEPEKRTEEEYFSSIDTWEERFKMAWPSAVDTLAAWAFPAVSLRVENKTKLFLSNVQLKIHLEGDVRGLRSVENDGELPTYLIDLPKPPRSWGPIEVNPLADMGRQHFVGGSDFIGSAYQSPLDWSNSGSIDLTLDIGDLRPNDTHLFEDDEIVLVVPTEETGVVHGSWQITADGYHEIYTGRLEVPVVVPKGITGALRGILRL